MMTAINSGCDDEFPITAKATLTDLIRYPVIIKIISKTSL